MDNPRSPSRSASPASAEAPGAGAGGIEITVNAPRAELEALQLELRELAKQHGIEIEFRLGRRKAG